VDIHRDRVADDDFARLGADERRERVAEPLPTSNHGGSASVHPAISRSRHSSTTRSRLARAASLAGAERVAVHI